MIHYTAPDAVSMGKAHHQLIYIGASHKITGELTLGFRKRPTREAKRILNRCGLKREPDDTRPLTSADWDRLEEEFS